MKKNTSPSFLLLIRNYARPFWKNIVLLIFLSLIGNLFTTLQPVIISGVVNATIGSHGEKIAPAAKDNAPLGWNKLFDLNKLGERVQGVIKKYGVSTGKNVWSPIIIMALLFLGAAFFSSLFNYLALIVNRLIRTESTRLIRINTLTHLLSLNIGFFNKQKSGELISRITQDATNTAQGIGPLVHSLIHHSILIIIYSIYLLSTSVWLTLGALCMIFLQHGLTQLIKKPVRRTERALFDRTADLVTTLQQSLTNIRVIKSFGAEKHELQKLGRDVDSACTADFKAGVIRHIEPHAREFLDSFAIIGIFLIATVQLMKGGLSVQGFLLFIYVGRLLIGPINKFSVNFVWIQSLLASYERLNELFVEKPEVCDGDIVKREFKDSIVLEEVSFSYGSELVIEDLSLTLKKGEVLALVGSSGGGKSTLCDLILRFYDPQKGRISIDGIDLKRLKVEEYRKIFGVVPQESLLFNDTISNNISYGVESIDQDKIINAAKIANAHDFITQLPDGYSTMVGDRGVRLSGGQRQRIAIARAIVSSPEILIFDEATSSLDTESEMQVQVAIDQVLENSTAIIVAHRLSTILHADKIVVMAGGQIEASGKHDELLAISSTYRRLYELQFYKGSNMHSDKQIGSPL